MTEKVYEYFSKDDVYINGRYRNYVDALWVQGQVKDSFITPLYNLYALATVIGLRLKRRLPDDTGERRTIQLAQLQNIKSELKSIMTLVLLLDESRGLTEGERVDSAFRTPTTEEVYKENVELFNSYMRGGLEYLYEKLVLRTSSIDDLYTDNRINNIIALLNDPLIPDIG